MKAATQKEIHAALFGRKKRRRVEHGVQDAVEQWVNTLPGFRVWRQNTGAVKFKSDDGRDRFVRFGIPGQYDLTGIGPFGIRVEIEIKRDADEELSERQEWWGDDIRNAGGIAFHCFSVEMCVVRMREEFQRRGWAWNPRWEV